MAEARSPAMGAAPLVGRAEEREAIAGALRTLEGTVLTLEGEPGIGKSRLLDHLGECAAAEGTIVLGARASESERDLPYALWTEALERHLAEQPEEAAALARVLPVLCGGDAAHADRHRTHRALRSLLERLAAARGLVLWIDDAQWADPASLDALAALIRRPPAGPVLFAVAAREGQLPTSLSSALAGAHREDRVVALRPAPLTATEATELVGGVATAIYARSGGNPFFLEQLARVRSTPGLGVGALDDDTVPPAVAAALSAEHAELAPDARALLEAAAVVGDPFAPELAAAVAELPEPAALRALDELLQGGLVRPAGMPRRFAFRHPIAHHAVYVATPPGWRLGAHARAADALRRRGAGAVQRAHHVEHAAHPGDEDAIALLSDAAAELQGPAPQAAARFYAAALRLLADGPAERERRSRFQLALADAQAAAGDAAAAHDTLVEALQRSGPGERLALTVALANQEWWLGGHEDARRRLQVVLSELPAQPSADRVRLRLALTLTAMLACDLGEGRAQASDARLDAEAIGDPVFRVAAVAADAVLSASAAAADAPDRVEASAAALDRLNPDQAATRLPSFWMHARARRLLGRPAAALADLQRGAALAERTGRERILMMLTIESAAALVALGRLADAAAAADEGLERARLAGNPRMLVWAQTEAAAALLAAGDVAGALRHAEPAAHGPTRADIHAAGHPGWYLGAALTAAGNPGRAVPVMLEAFGPSYAGVVPAERAAAAADLVEAHLALGDVALAEAALEAGGETAAPPAIAAAAIARAAVSLARSDPRAAVAAAAAAREAAAGLPLLAARALLTEGQALAAAGDREGGVRALVAAEAAFDGFGARRRRDEAVRELRRLGHRVVRPARGNGDGPLTARELEIAEFVAAGRTNREIAEQLVLSTRTIEAHLRNIYAKLDVRSRVELARHLQS